MLFNSLAYLGLFFFTYLLYWNIPDRFKKFLLLFSSLVFYGYFNFYFLFHFLLAIAINYAFSLRLWKLKSEGKSTKYTTYTIVTLNILNLAFFKYFYFFTDIYAYLSGNESIRSILGTLHIFLPLAISFYSFQLIALQVDIHREVEKEKIPVLDYFLFILFFPQLIAGPIMRTGDFLPQINSPQINPDKMKKGILLVLGGLFKKVVIAESIGPIIAPLFANPGEYNFVSSYLSTLAFAIQVYCDFSGYTDIARGSANLLGYEIPENFLGPFLSGTYRELWGRWHITLSSWLRDYVYIPLGGNKKGFHFSNLNMLLTMAIGGLWHGANICYVLWGVYLGFLLGAERYLEKLSFLQKFYSPELKIRIPRTIFIFHLFVLSGIFFRAGSAGLDSVRIAFGVFKNLFTFADGKLMERYYELPTLILLGLLFNAFQYFPSIYEKGKKYTNILIPIFSVIMLLLLATLGDGGGDFIYFQF